MGIVVAIVPFYLPYPGGSEKSTHEMLLRMVKLGFEVEALIPIAPFSAAPVQSQGTVQMDGVTIRRLDVEEWFSIIETSMQKADIVFFSLASIFRQVFDCKVDIMLSRYRYKVVYFCRGIDPLDYFPAAFIVANSRACLETLPERPGVKRLLLTPVISAPELHPQMKRKFITIINPSEIKGGRVFFEIARRLPQVFFIAQLGRSVPVEGLDQIPNIAIREPSPDLSRLYAETKVLLVPSIEEPFGRIALEGAYAGCLLLLHRSGGLQELPVPDFCYIDNLEPDLWAEKLTQLLNSGEEELSEKLVNIKRMSSTYNPGWDAFVKQMNILIESNNSIRNIKEPEKEEEQRIKTVADAFTKYMQTRLLWDKKLVKNPNCICKMLVTGAEENSWIIDFNTHEIKRDNCAAAFTIKISEDDLMNLVNHKTTIEFLLNNRRIIVGGDMRNLFLIIRLLQ